MNALEPITDFSHYPSLVADHASARTSNRYAFIPTDRLISVLDRAGWKVANVLEKRNRNSELRSFGEHLVRFRRLQDFNRLAVIGEHIPEIVLTGSHDGTAAWEMLFGLWRFVCGNGAIVADGMFATHRIKHIGYQDQNVIEAVADVVESAPKVLDRVKEWQALPLEPKEQLALAESAIVAKYGEEGLSKYNPQRLLVPVRREDTEKNLWTTYNVLQEKLVEKGGRFAENNNNTRRHSSYKKARGIQSVSENVRVNQALWMLADKMAQLKK